MAAGSEGGLGGNVTCLKDVDVLRDSQDALGDMREQCGLTLAIRAHQAIPTGAGLGYCSAHCAAREAVARGV